ncbi:MAG: GNAT family N-acetyltransferase [Tetrasphaera sp.]|nr:GNAT family N-acetyltransferase [Tetrasphaera sp.]
MPSLTMPVLHAGPVVLRAFEEGDTPLIQSVANDPLIPLITTVPTTGTTTDALAYISRQHDRLSSGAGYSFAIAAADTGEAVGQIGLWLQDISAGRASIGYWIASHHRRRGLLGPALSTLAQWAWAIEDLHRIEAYVEPWNVPSWRAVEGCGFQREGLLRSWQEVGDQRKDMYVYSLIREDSQASREHERQDSAE